MRFFRNAQHSGKAAVFCFAMAICFLMACTGEEGSKASETPNVAEVKVNLVYYELPGCPFCAKIKTLAGDLEKEHNGALKIDVRDMNTPESQKELKDLGFASHGMAIYDADGNLKEKLDGHRLTEEEIRRAVQVVF